MKQLIVIVIVFILGFLLGTGAGFRIFEGISSDLMLEAFDTSVQKFSESSVGASMQATIDQEKVKLEDKIKAGILDYVKQKLGMENETTDNE